MNNIIKDAYDITNHLYDNGIKPLICENEDLAYIDDPIFGIKRNRVVAEVLKTIIRLRKESEKNVIESFCNYLIKNQNKDGSWNEIHSNYNQPSSLITSIVGEALLIVNEIDKQKNFYDSISRACNYVLSQEKSPGFFVKSKYYTADHLNVDATCGAFLALYGKKFSEDKIINIARRTAAHVHESQSANGSYPYAIDKGNYAYTFNVPCIHYQGVTMYYLSKINEVIKEEWLIDDLKKGAKWLSDVQLNDGRFDWSKSGLMFSYHLSGAYAFAFSSFIYASEWNNKYLENANLCIDILKKNIQKLILRWELDTWKNFPKSMEELLKTSSFGKCPIKERVFRFGYGLYRQIARRRYSDNIDERLFKYLLRLLNIESSTIEPFNNYPDLFITSEVLDCLSHSIIFIRGDETVV